MTTKMYYGSMISTHCKKKSGGISTEHSEQQLFDDYLEATGSLSQLPLNQKRITHTATETVIERFYARLSPCSGPIELENLTGKYPDLTSLSIEELGVD